MNNIYNYNNDDEFRIKDEELLIKDRFLLPASTPRQKHLIKKMMEGYKKATENKEYDVTVVYYHNMPSITTTKTLTVDATNEIEAESKVRQKFPNITSIMVEKCPKN